MIPEETPVLVALVAIAALIGWGVVAMIRFVSG